MHLWGGVLNKIKIIFLVLIISFNIVLAKEKSGLFIGAGLGVDVLNTNANFIYRTSYRTPFIFNNNNINIIQNMYQLIGGYKYMMPSSKLGFRTYLNYDCADYTLLGVNFDILYNPSILSDYISSDYVSGLFIGINVGIIDYNFDSYYKYYYYDYYKKYKKNNFYIFDDYNNYQFYSAIQTGLRVTFIEKYTLELFTKIPFTRYDYRNYKYSIKQNFNLGIRYIYTF